MLASPQGSVGVGLSHAARRTWLVPSHCPLLGRWSRRGGRRQQKKQSRQDEDEAEQRTIDLLRDGLTHSFIQRGMNDVFSVVSVLFIIFFSSLLFSRLSFSCSLLGIICLCFRFGLCVTLNPLLVTPFSIVIGFRFASSHTFISLSSFLSVFHC